MVELDELYRQLLQGYRNVVPLRGLKHAQAIHDNVLQPQKLVDLAVELALSQNFEHFLGFNHLADDVGGDLRFERARNLLRELLRDEVIRGERVLGLWRRY